jgi:hypothetical protein
VHTVQSVHTADVSRVLVITPKGVVLVHRAGFTKPAAIHMAKAIRAHLKSGGKLAPASWQIN